MRGDDTEDVAQGGFQGRSVGVLSVILVAGGRHGDMDSTGSSAAMLIYSGVLVIGMMDR